MSESTGHIRPGKTHRLRPHRRIVAWRAAAYHPPDHRLLVHPLCFIRPGRRHVLTAVLAFAVGVVAWLIAASLATGGFEAYFSATSRPIRMEVRQTRRVGARHADQRLLFAVPGCDARRLAWSGLRANASDHEPYRKARGSRAVRDSALCHLRLAQRSQGVARPYMIASAVNLLMLFILLPIRHLRYFLPFCLIVGWSVSGYLALLRRPPVRAVGASGPVCRHRVALVLPRRHHCQGPTAGRRSRLGQGKPSGHPPLFRFTSAACRRLSARRRNEIGAKV